VQSFAARGFQDTFKLQVFEPLTHFNRGAFDFGPWYIFVRVKVEHNAIGLRGSVGAAAPNMDLQHARLDQRDQPLDIIDRDERLAVTFSSNLDLANGCGVASASMTLKKTRSPFPGRAADEAEGTARDMHEHPGRDLLIIGHKILLGQVLFGKQHLVRMAGAAPSQLELKREKNGLTVRTTFGENTDPAMKRRCWFRGSTHPIACAVAGSDQECGIRTGLQDGGPPGGW
jgi:hypothetical protein